MSLLSAEEKLFAEAFHKKLLVEPDAMALDLSLIGSFILWGTQVIRNNYDNREPVLTISNNLKKKCIYIMSKVQDDKQRYAECVETIWKLRLFEAQNRQLDSYFLYLEKEREPKDRFYQPKRKQFYKIGLTQALQDILDDKLDILTISMPPGTGKGQLYDDEILTPDGYIKFRDLKIGSEVISGTGDVSRVLGIFPKPQMSVYEVVFDDGSKVKCSQDHIWHVQTRDDRRRNPDRYRNVELKDMLKNFRVESGKRANYSVGYVPKIDCFNEKELLIDPYILGVLIGDGSLTSNNMQFSVPDNEIVDEVRNRLPSGYELAHPSKYGWNIKCGKNRINGRHGMKSMLESYGLYNKYSHEKFIPRDYLYSSYENRLSLLRGLMDTDGYVGRAGAEYSTSSEQLAKDVCELAHSLGGYCSIAKKTNCGYRNAYGVFVKCKDSYRLTIQFNANQPKPFLVKRKAEKFNPKREVIRRFITDIRYIGDEETVCIYIDDPSHLYITNDYVITHNSTISRFFLTGVIGWFPDDYNLFFSHSDGITRKYYDDALRIVTDKTEYAWADIFPNLKVNHTNAKAQEFNVGRPKMYNSLQCSTRGSNNAGIVRASKFLLVDDMIAKIEEAMNKQTLEKLWDVYSTDARQRKTVDVNQKPAKEIHLATRWSVHDVIGRLQNLYEGNPRFRSIAVPAIDPVTGKSNFDYEYNGFSEEFFHDQELTMDEISYRCLYMSDPIEREGLLYPEDELRRYLSLPNAEPDAIIGVCDTKSTGIDDMVLPVMYKYGDDYYMEACVCDDSTNFGVQIEKLSNIIIEHNMQQCEFESNAGGDRLARDVAAEVDKQGGRCNITSKPTESNKETRIIVNSDWVKRHVLFKDESLYTKKSDYGKFMTNLTTYSVVGNQKTKRDDVPDCLANFALFVTRSLYRRKTKIRKSPI